MSTKEERIQESLETIDRTPEVRAIAKKSVRLMMEEAKPKKSILQRIRHLIMYRE